MNLWHWLRDRPAGVRLVQCDHKGNASRYGIYWKAVGPGGETDIDQHQESVIFAARRRWGSAGSQGREQAE